MRKVGNNVGAVIMSGRRAAGGGAIFVPVRWGGRVWEEEN